MCSGEGRAISQSPRRTLVCREKGLERGTWAGIHFAGIAGSAESVNKLHLSLELGPGTRFVSAGGRGREGVTTERSSRRSFGSFLAVWLCMKFTCDVASTQRHSFP